MNITVRIDKIVPDDALGSVRAYASVSFSGEYAVHGIQICKSIDGELFIHMPARIINGKWTDMFHPLNNEARRKMIAAVLDEYIRVQK